MTQTESPFVRKVLLALGSLRELRVWRQNVGTILIRGEEGGIQRAIHAGPPTGAADISGIVVGSGRRIEIECKVMGRKRTKEQELWGQFIERSGGVYALVTDEEPIESAVERVMEKVRGQCR